MRVLCKGRLLTTTHIWFENYPDRQALRRVGIPGDQILLHGNASPIGDDSHIQYTLRNDLSGGEEDIFALFTSTVKNEIRRAAREETVAKVYTSEDIQKDDAVLEGFAAMYHEMYAEKGMDGVYLPMAELKAYVMAGNLTVTTATMAEQVVVYHSYVHEGEFARLWHSCSEFRVADNATRNAIGRANKFLHWEDMRYLKRKGVIDYDWGGVVSFEQPNGIDKFKMSFGGSQAIYYNIMEENSLRAKLIHGLLRLKKRS